MSRFPTRLASTRRWALTIIGFCLMGLPPVHAANPWIELKGGDGPGKGKHVVLIAADDEYRSEELIPQLAQILAKRQGFDCTVLFAINKADGTIDPSVRDNIPNLDALKSADLLVLFARFRELPDDQMKLFMDYVESGRPIVALRTSTHSFNYDAHKESPYARFDWRSQDPKGGFGRLVLGETWVNHYGNHQVESTRGLIVDSMKSHPIVRGIESIWGPSDVYELTTLSGDSQPVVLGQVLKGMKPEDEPNPDKKLVPVAWIKTYTGAAGKPARIFTTTMGHSGDFECEGFRRLLVNASLWAVGLEDKIPEKAVVDYVGTYRPTPIGGGKHKTGLKPSDLVSD